MFWLKDEEIGYIICLIRCLCPTHQFSVITGLSPTMQWWLSVLLKKQLSYYVPESYKETEQFYVVCRPYIFFKLSVTRSKYYNSSLF